MNKALVIIDVQNDYFSGGAYPQFEADAILEPIKKAIEQAKKQDWLVVFVKHESTAGFLVKGSSGAEIHPELLPYLSDSTTIIKHHADAFLNTNLTAILQAHRISELMLTGIMTQNCITHTAISPQATKYDISVFANACTAPTQMIHQLAVRALSNRVTIIEQT